MTSSRKHKIQLGIRSNLINTFVQKLTPRGYSFTCIRRVNTVDVGWNTEIVFLVHYYDDSKSTALNINNHLLITSTPNIAISIRVFVSNINIVAVFIFLKQQRWGENLIAAINSSDAFIVVYEWLSPVYGIKVQTTKYSRINLVLKSYLKKKNCFNCYDIISDLHFINLPQIYIM